MNGIITNIPLKEGASVVATNAFTDGTTIATIADMGSLRFVGKIDETEVEALRQGMDMTLTVGAIHGTTFKGRVEDIATKGINDNGTIMFEVTGSIEATGQGMAIGRDGYSANASIVTNRVEKVMSVEETAVEYENGKAYVYRLVGKQQPEDECRQPTAVSGSFERTEVVLGLSDGIYIQILKGVAPTDKLRGNKRETKKL
jgi:HlyD family secretion protein